VLSKIRTTLHSPNPNLNAKIIDLNHLTTHQILEHDGCLRLVSPPMSGEYQDWSCLLYPVVRTPTSAPPMSLMKRSGTRLSRTLTARPSTWQRPAKLARPVLSLRDQPVLNSHCLTWSPLQLRRDGRLSIRPWRVES
jgi:hypothetical protein